MPKVTLAKHWAPGADVLAPGAVVDVDDATAKWLERCGAVAHDLPAKADKPTPDKPTPQPKPEPVEKPAGGLKRPPKTAPVDKWRKYAESQGIIPKGLSKKELIAATR